MYSVDNYLYIQEEYNLLYKQVLVMMFFECLKVVKQIYKLISMNRGLVNVKDSKKEKEIQYSGQGLCNVPS